MNGVSLSSITRRERNLQATVGTCGGEFCETPTAALLNCLMNLAEASEPGLPAEPPFPAGPLVDKQMPS